jgi:hypothetical protein
MDGRLILAEWLGVGEPARLGTDQADHSPANQPNHLRNAWYSKSVYSVFCAETPGRKLHTAAGMVWGAVVLESMRLCPLWNTRVNFKNALGNV